MKYKKFHIIATKTLDTLSGILSNVDVWPTNKETLICTLQGYAMLFHHAATTFDALVLLLKRERKQKA